MQHFINDTHAYGRDLNIVSNYHHDTATYIAKMTGQDMDYCLSWVKQQTSPGGTMAGHDPELLCLSKETPGNRTRIPMTFLQYLHEVEERKALTSPTMAAYLNPNERKSILAKYIDGNIKLRSKVKKQMFQDKMDGNKQAAADGQKIQSTFKIKNNSLSGAHASPYTPLFNKSTHSTLTSTCRSATGYANANNERFLFGNRHYYALNVTLENIISIVNQADYALIERAMVEYELVVPSVADVCAAIKRSTDLYWANSVWTAQIEALVSKLTDIERAAYLYTADMYHLRVLNPDMVYNFLDKLSTKLDTPHPDPDPIIKALDADLIAYIGILCSKELNGNTIWDAKDKNPENYAIIANNAANVIGVLDSYRLLIRAFWVTNSPPSAIAFFTDSIRRGVLVSDTDSTIFTVQDWTTWFLKGIKFGEKNDALCAAIVYMASQTTIHLLAQLSGAMGVIPEHMSLLSMKNEFMFPTLLLTSRAKHYASYISAQEGNVFPKMDTEIKGVALKSSKAPQHVIDKLHKFIMEPMDLVLASKKVSVKKMLTEVAELEREIENSISTGKVDYLTTSNIKERESYANPKSSNFIYYDMWEMVFAPKYGPAPLPPYRAVKVSMRSTSGTTLRKWIDSIEDKEMAERLKTWVSENNRLGGMQQILVPIEVAVTSGIPKEITMNADTRKVVYSTVEPFYLILESFGVYMRDKNITKLVSDFH